MGFLRQVVSFSRFAYSALCYPDSSRSSGSLAAGTGSRVEALSLSNFLAEIGKALPPVHVIRGEARKTSFDQRYRPPSRSSDGPFPSKIVTLHMGLKLSTSDEDFSLTRTRRCSNLLSGQSDLRPTVRSDLPRETILIEP